MQRHGIPTARYETADSPAEATEILESGDFGPDSTPVVVKADGLAAGKGVIVASDRAEAISAVNSIEDLVGPAAAASIVLEECLFGREVSLLMFADDKVSHLCRRPATISVSVKATGPNTGGMGTITDSSL